MAEWSPIYDDGTARVETGDATVIGQGTFWATNGLRAGDQFRAQGLSVTIEEIVSDTEIAIKPWPGADLAEDGYEIIRVNDADRLIAATQVFMEHMLPNISAFALLNGSAGKVPVFTGAGAMSLVDKGSLVEGVSHDAVVADLAGRAAHDDAAQDFGVLVTDNGDGRSAIYFKLSADSADWSDPAYVTGVQGFDGISAGLPFRFSASTAISVPASGDIRLNHADFDSVTQAAVSDGIFTDGTPDASAYVNLWSAGQLLLAKRSAPENFAVYKVTSCVDNTGWTRLNLDFIAASGSFSAGDALAAQFLADAATDSAAAAAASAAAAEASADAAADDAEATAADRVQTGLDRVATGEDATATAADRVQTGEDRTATEADATATAADRVQTGLDAVATGDDATATAADRVQTGQDRVATGEDATATAADRVQTGLDRVATGDDATATAADRVQTGLDRTATGEDATATAADRVQTGEDRVATGDDATATAADRVQTGLDRIATGEDATATAADRVQTGADVLASAVYRDETTVLRDQTLVYRDEGAAQALLSQGYAANAAQTKTDMDTALSGVTNYDNTLAQVRGAWKQLIAQTDVVAHFIYDTTKDSDGGAWRHWRKRLRSWWNETLGTSTRGTRADFPQNVGIVVRSAASVGSLVTLYDLDDASCPMWMVFQGVGSTASNMGFFNNTAAINSISMLNGVLFVGETSIGLTKIDFITDGSFRYRQSGGSFYGTNRGTISQRNAGLGSLVDVATAIANNTVNAVAAYVAQGTPRDFTRAGLPTPTVAVGTAGGVSVIHPDGRVTNGSSTTVKTSVAFGADGTLYVGVSSTAVEFSPPSEYAQNSFARRYYSGANGYPVMLGGNVVGVTAMPGGFAKASASGLTLVRHAPGSGLKADEQNNRSSVAYITRDYSTGWMTGNTLYCGAESTRDQTNLVGLVLSDDFSSYADTAAVIAAGWNKRAGVSGSVALVAGEFQYSRDAGEVGGVAAGRIVSGFAVGVRYRIRGKIRVVSGGGTAFIAMRTSDGGGGTNLVNSSTVSASDPTPVSILWTADAASRHLAVHASNNGATVALDDVVIERLAEDRSAAGNQPTIVGTVTRTPVATNAELCAYTGFSASNYLELPYTSAFDFGTGDWSQVIWASYPSGGTMISRGYFTGGAYSGARWHLTTSGGAPRLVISDGTNTLTLTGPTSLANTGYRRILIQRRGTTAELWVDRDLVASGSLAGFGSLSNVNASLRYGNAQDGGTVYSAFSGQMTLMRPSGSSVTPAQIRQMYADEAPLFQPGAKCLLTETNVVNDVGYSTTLGELFVAKAAGGTDVINGLTRVRSITMASENSYGPNLIANGSFDANITGVTAGGGATLSWDASGQLSFGRIAAATETANFPALTGLTIGRTYRVTGTVSAFGGGSARMRIGTTLGGTETATIQQINAGTAETFSGTFVATATTHYLSLAYTANATRLWDNISVVSSAERMTSNNHKKVSPDNDNLIISTDVDVYVKTAAVGLREAALDRDYAPKYDRNVVRVPSAHVTTNATPTVIGYLPMDKGEDGTWIIRVSARQDGEPAAPELAGYEVRVRVQRPQEGNVAVVGSAGYTTIAEVTSSMDLTVAANTTVQALALTGTGVASKNIEWGYEALFIPSIQQVAA